MTIEKIEIHNYRSIANESILLKKINNSTTYCLLGINESGKSSFLKGVALYDLDEIDYPQDFFDEKTSVKLSFTYKISQDDLNSLRNKLIKTFLFPKDLAMQVEVSSVIIVVEFPANVSSQKTIEEIIYFKKEILKGYKLEDKTPIKIEKGDNSGGGIN